MQIDSLSICNMNIWKNQDNPDIDETKRGDEIILED